MALLKYRRNGRDFLATLALIGVASASGCSFKSLDHLNVGDAGPNENIAKASGGELAYAGAESAGAPANGGSGGSEPRTNGGTNSTELAGGVSGAVGGSAGASGDAGASTAGASGDAGAGGNSVVPQHQAVLVVGALPLDASDTIFAQRLNLMGYSVVTAADEKIGTTDLTKADVITITRSTESEIINTQLRDLAKPIVVWEPMLYDELGMVQRTNGAFGVVTGQKGIGILNEKSPLAAGLKGEVIVSTVLGEITFGTPNDAADRVAGTPGESGRATIFAYEKGVEMPRLKAPERRVGLFFSDRTAENATDQAWLLFEAAVRWADGS